MKQAILADIVGLGKLKNNNCALYLKLPSKILLNKIQNSIIFSSIISFKGKDKSSV